MESTFKIFWSQEAINNLGEIIAYLEANWTQRELKRFAQKTEKFIISIQRNPFIFPESRKKHVRRALLSKQTTIYYEVLEHEIRIVTVFDNRQNPANLKL